MSLEKKYREAFKKMDTVIKEHVEKERYPAMGYTSNLDLLCDFNARALNNLLEKHVPNEKLTDMKPPNMIKTIKELLHTLVYYAANGIGGEADIEDIDLIKNNFMVKNGMGGTAVQAALALSEVGCPSVVHLTDDSKEVCDMLQTPFIYTVAQNGERIPAKYVKQTKEQEVHCIVQFKKGDLILLKDQRIAIPVSNRVILTKITVNGKVPFSDAYFQYVEKNAQKIGSNVLSSFNSIQEKEILMERLQYIKKHVKIYKENNPNGIVYFEDAHYHNKEIRKACIETIYSSCDIISLNEEELEYSLKMYSFPINPDSILSCVEGVKFLRTFFKVKKGVIVHTKDYSMYVGDHLNADMETGLIYGNLLATAKAVNGWYGSKTEVREILDIPLSEKGLLYVKELRQSKYAGEAILVPTKYIDKPRYTIGLGDSFMGGVQICF